MRTPEEHAAVLAAHARLILGEQPWLWDRIAAALRAAVLEEREACARLADAEAIHPSWLGDPKLGLTDNSRRIAAAIRART